MNRKLQAFKEKAKNMKAAVLGVGVSNTPLIQYLARLGADVTAFDRAEADAMSAQMDMLAGLNVKYSVGEGYLDRLNGFDCVFKTPIVRPDIPELLAERSRGAVITSEMELFLELCPCTVFGITGSDGKTTTSTLICEMLKASGYTCHLGGNIGTPLLPKIDSIQSGDMAVVELSSFQLQTLRKGVNIAVVTNVTPNHLDVHKSYAEYIDAKRNIFALQRASDMCVLNYDNEITRGMASEVTGKIRFFSLSRDLTDAGGLRRGLMESSHAHGNSDGAGEYRGSSDGTGSVRGNPDGAGSVRHCMAGADGQRRDLQEADLRRGYDVFPEAAACVRDGYIAVTHFNSAAALDAPAAPESAAPESAAPESAAPESAAPESAAPESAEFTAERRVRRMLDIRDIRIPGSHNVENYLAAICAAEPFATVSAIRDTAVKFAGVEHRIEYVRTINGARYYNDSSSSGPTRTIACLKAFPDKVILIAGGKDKALDYSILGEWLATKVKLLVLCGQTSEKIKNSLLACRNGSNAVPLVECASLEDAVRAAWENAAMHDVVVMSPASTSFDRFKNFEERGRVFKALVNALPDSTLNYPPTSRTAQ